MNSGQTTERVYDAIKQRIAARACRPGDRLDPSHLAAELNSSVTPVRDALHLLTGEGLVIARVGDGFHVPHIDAPALEDMYAWNLEVLGLAMRGWAAHSGIDAGSASGGGGAAIASVFAVIAAQAGNAEHVRTIRSLNDRFEAIRVAETIILPGCEEEFDRLLAALRLADTADLRAGLGSYHRRRRRLAAEIVRALYRAS